MNFDTDILQNPVAVDTKAIAKGLYELFDENEKACIAFGMIPEAKIKPVREHLSTIAEKLWPDADKVFSQEELQEFKDIGFDIAKANEERTAKERKDFISEVEHQICIDLYGVAPMVV